VKGAVPPVSPARFGAPSGKTMAERVLLATGLGYVRRAMLTPRVLVLAYHNVVPGGDFPCGERALHLPRALFERQLDLLLRTHDVVPLEDALSSAAPRSRRPRAVITFDDAYRGAVTVGVDALARRGLPATFFVAPAFVGGGSFWWDRFSEDATGTLPPSFRDHALEALRGRNAEVEAWATEAGYRATALPPHAHAATEEELRRAVWHPGIVLASHTWSHPNLAALDAAELEEELTRPLRWLRERCERVVPWLSYPYGISSPAVERAAAKAGYRGGLRVEGGWVRRRPENPFAIPRLNIPAGLSPAGFALRASGLFCD
jgi:peptidoglycan/xylan/chitin deacetylase (PgdA/CDA1 family)